MTSGIKLLRSVSILFGSKLARIHNIAEIYKPTMNRSRDRLIDLIKEKAALARQSEFAKKINTAKGFYTLEMAPPRFNEMEKLKADLTLLKEFFKSDCYKYLTVKQAWLLFLVGTEVGLWFFLGETIGKMHFVGYKV